MSLFTELSSNNSDDMKNLVNLVTNQKSKIAKKTGFYHTYSLGLFPKTTESSPVNVQVCII